MIEDLINQAVNVLREHCTSVHVMVSFQEEGQTRSIHRGCGDFYARMGLAHEFIESTNQKDTAVEIASALKND